MSAFWKLVPGLDSWNCNEEQREMKARSTKALNFALVYQKILFD